MTSCQEHSRDTKKGDKGDQRVQKNEIMGIDGTKKAQEIR